MKCNCAWICSALLTLPTSSLVCAECSVWTVSETRHVLRSEQPTHTTTVQVAAARNEWVSFQIFLRSQAPIKSINLEAGDLRGPRGALIPGTSARLYREHQVRLETGTYRNDNFKSDWYPDPLIPFTHPITAKNLRTGRFVAVPFDLPAGETHGFWIDIYIPTNAVPGEYRGSYQITSTGGATHLVPVSLTVWSFVLPQTPTLVTEFGFPNLRDYYRRISKTSQAPEPPDWNAVDAQCDQLLSEHHFNVPPPLDTVTPKGQPDGSYLIASAQVRALREFVDTYHLNAIQTPHPSNVVKDPEAERERLRSWLRAFDRAGVELDRTNVVFYTYLRDEPNTLEDYRYVQKWGRAIREAKSVLKVLVVEQPWTAPGEGGADSAWGDLYGAVDIWCPLFSLHRQESAAERQALGETIWTYTALCQGPPTPWWHIDFPLLNYRVPTWMAWRDSMKGLLYWGGMSYWNQTEDPWTQAPFYTGNGQPQQGAKGIVFQGEGSLVYPALAVGYDGIVPTIRLKALRDAIEDYDYFALLQRCGKTSEAQEIVRSLTPTFSQWNKDPVAYEQARARIAAMIVSQVSGK
ncbi:MAG TPA: glycoside hydrolase domain-containing protein [Candidatus Limnocylindrales bacterium]|nr:glycoside hydrolase domain-containing protein [Candidatus Limnocylindrales bacterium]